MIRKLVPLFMIALVLTIASVAHAIDPIPQESGFSGFLRAGAGILNYKSNQVAGNRLMDIGQETTASLTDAPDSDTTGLFLVNFELAYTFADTRTQLFFGSQLEDIARLDLGQQLAIKQELPDKSIVALGFLFTTIPTEVWKDPYVTDSPRQETDRTSTGGRLVYDRILGSNFEFRYSYRTIEIDDEQSGVNLGLTTPQRDLLRRDGKNHALDLSYRFNFKKRHLLVPDIRYIYRDLDGDAMRNQGVDFQLTYFFFNDPVTLVFNGLVGTSDYDEENPIYGKTREDDRFGAGAQVYYKNPFGWKPFGQEDFSAFAAVSYFIEDANIDFYDTEVSTLQVGVLLRF